MLVVGTRFDPATPYAFTQPYADRWPDARVLTVEGWGHTIIGKSACTQDVVPFQGPSVSLGEALRLPVT